MASSSVSQESLDREDFEYTARRNRCRVLRARGPAPYTKVEPHESDDVTEQPEGGDGDLEGPGEHESPTRLASRSKEKRPRPNHLHKGKTVKDKRKLREKRRSTGVVHLPSTESTGDSLDDDDEDGLYTETRRNTTLNEGPDAVAEETRVKEVTTRRQRNKSPSDLEADLEDNQDYDSTVSQSETNLTVVGSGSPKSKGIMTKSGHGYDAQTQVHVTQEDDTRGRSALQSSRFRDHEWDRRRAYSPDSHRSASRYGITETTRSVREGGIQERTSPSALEVAKLLTQTKELEKLLQQEREEKKKLIEMVEERDARIAQLEQEVSLLGKELDLADEDCHQVQQENRVLMCAMATLSLQS